MLLELFLALVVGIIAGTFTGLAPGIHINLVALLLLISSGFFLQFTAPIVLAAFIVAMAITHSFLDFITSIFLGCPEESTALSVLPGHKMLLEGRGYEACKLSLLGSYLGLLLMLITAPLVLLFLPNFYSTISFLVPYILIAASLFLIIKDQKPFIALFLFLFSGILGMAALSFSVIKQPLFPLLTGLFGLSTLITSISEKTKVPKQKITLAEIDKDEMKNALSSSFIASFFCSFLPGLGAAQAAVLSSSFYKKLSQKTFLFLLGAISTIVIGFNFIALYAIQKPRSGTSVIVGKLLETITLNQLVFLLIIMLVSGSVAVLLGIYFAKLFAKNINRINYIKLNYAVIIFLTIISIFISGWLSLLILITSTAIGILAIKTSIKRMHLMGCLIIPVIIYFLF